MNYWITTVGTMIIGFSLGFLVAWARTRKLEKKRQEEIEKSLESDYTDIMKEIEEE
jgi:uncharacterized membrane-anchored protein YhcB (DUF1043 family)